MNLYLLPFCEWWLGFRENLDPADNWLWAIGLVCIEVVRVR